MVSYLNEEERYWNEEGGNRWIQHIAFLERMLEPLNQLLLDALKPETSERILEIGCGGGPTSALLSARVGTKGSVVALDVSKPLIKYAQQRFSTLPNISFQHVDAATGNLGQSPFDAVTSRFGVMFFPEPAHAFRNIRNSLTQSGRLCMMCWRTAKENPWMTEAASVAYQYVPPPEPVPPGSPGPFSLGEESHCYNILLQAGYKNIEFESVDCVLDMGTAIEAKQLLCSMGPAARALESADMQTVASIEEAILNMLDKHCVNGSIRIAGALWIISAAA